mgnify:FL=1
MSVAVGTVLKKIAEAVAATKKGRKAIGYTIGITAFLLLLPMIVITGLFGWMGRSDVEIDHDEIISGLTPEQIEQIEGIDFETTGEETE